MKPVWTTIAAIAALAGAAAPDAAQAQSSSSVFIVGSPNVAEHLVTIPARLTGEVTVSFHGDQRTGCAARGVCGVAGSVYWQPPRIGGLELTALGRHAPPQSVTLFFGGGSATFGEGAGALTTERVQTVSGSTQSMCNDETTVDNVDLPIHHGTLRLGPDIAAVRTRCAGPLAADLTSAWPIATLRVGAALRGRRVLGLSSSRPFAAHGFAGTVTSTLRIVLGRPRTTTLSNPKPTRRGTRLRTVTVSYKATVAGQVLIDVAGNPRPEFCAPLGSCGLAGSIRVVQPLTHATLNLSATTAASRPRRDLLAAVGLSAVGRTRGILTFGSMNWNGGGSVTALMRGGSADCHDTIPGAGGSIAFVLVRSRIVSLLFNLASGPLTLPRTRCPGPFVPTGHLGSTSVPLSAFRHRVVHIATAQGAAFHDDGYVGRSHPQLTITLTRTRVRTSVQVIPAVSRSRGTSRSG